MPRKQPCGIDTLRTAAIQQLRNGADNITSTRNRISRRDFRVDGPSKCLATANRVTLDSQLMRIVTLKTSSLLAAVSIVVGCSDLTPLQNAGIFGAAGGAAAGGIAHATGASTGQSVAIGAATGAAVAAVTYVIAKHQATERQHRIAEERAQRAYARMSAERKSQMKARKTRYIAVDTEKNDQTAAGAKESVMIWDTQSQEVVGNNVYDVKSPPPVGSTAKFDTYSAEYVGSGG